MPPEKWALGLIPSSSTGRDVGYSGSCCDNDSYCYIDSSFQPRCCPIGSNCPGNSRCSSDSYYCTRAVTQSGTMTTVDGCCGRLCPQTSQYLCAISLGGNCCPYDSECRVSGNCVSTVTPTFSSSPLLSPVPSGCTTSQFQCADGNGCCDDWQHCTQVSGTGYCADGNPTNSAAAFTASPASSTGGLTAGAKAGIAVGVVVGAGLLVGALAWLCVSKRRHQRSLSPPSASGADVGQPAPRTDASVAEVDAERLGPVRRSAVRSRGGGVTRDYFGPDAIPGPFTETGDPKRVTSPGPGRAVPSQPHQPGDIATPVEIDSQSKATTSPVVRSSPSDEANPAEYATDGPFELYGSGRPTLALQELANEAPVGGRG